MQLADLEKKQQLVVGAVVLLILLNIWRWWPEDASTSRAMHSNSGKLEVLDESLLDRLQMGKGKSARISRNMFVPVEKSLTVNTAEAEKNTPLVVEAKADTRQQNLDKFKLEGILDEEGKKQALLSRDDKLFIVTDGQKFASHFQVKKIALDRILLRDNNSAITKWIKLSGE